MPRIVEVTYERVKNLGNYQTERLGCRVTCEPEEAERAMAVAKCYVWDSLGLPVSDGMRALALEAGPPAAPDRA